MSPITLTLESVAGMRLFDDDGHCWGTVETNGAGWSCEGCGSAITRAYFRRVNRAGDRIHRCSHCVTVDISKALEGEW